MRATVREGAAQSAALRAEVDIARQQVRVDVDQARLTIVAGKAALVGGRALARERERRGSTSPSSATAPAWATASSCPTRSSPRPTPRFQLLQATLKLDTARAQLLKALGRS